MTNWKPCDRFTAPPEPLRLLEEQLEEERVSFVRLEAPGGFALRVAGAAVGSPEPEVLAVPEGTAHELLSGLPPLPILWLPARPRETRNSLRGRERWFRSRSED